MPRFIAALRWEEHLTDDEVAEMCFAKLECRLQVQKLRWFGCVLSGEAEGIVKVVFEMLVAGCRPVERPRKSWRKLINEHCVLRTEESGEHSLDV